MYMGFFFFLSSGCRDRTMAGEKAVLL